MEAASLRLCRKDLMDFILSKCTQPTSSAIKNWSMYSQQLQAFIVGNLTKREFDRFLMRELGSPEVNPELVPLHNAYIMSILVSLALAHSCADSFTSLTDSLTHWITGSHSLTHSLTHSLSDSLSLHNMPGDYSS